MTRYYLRMVWCLVIKLYLMQNRQQEQPHLSDFSIFLEDSLQPTGYDYDTAYIILDSSDTGFVDEHGKIDLESGVMFGELDGLF